MFCPNCGKANEDSAKVCVECGTAFETEVAQQTDLEPAYQETEVQEAAENVVEEATETVADAGLTEEYAGEEGKSKKTKKLIIGLIAAVVVVAAAFGIFKFVSGMLDGDVDYSKFPIVYQKDDEIFVRPDGKKESYEIADADGEYSYYSSRVAVTDDAKYIFFADSATDEEFSLYYRKTKDMDPKEGKGERLAKDVTGFMLIPGTNKVLYQRDDKLCYHDLKDEVVIDKDIDSMYGISKDGKKVLYSSDYDSENYSYDLYISKLAKKAEPEKIDSDVTEVLIDYEETDLKNIYYVKDNDTLYLKKDGKDKEKIASDISGAQIIGEKVYVLKSESKELKYDDIINDDVFNGNIPDSEDMEAPRYSDYDDYDDYDAAFDEYYEEYRKAYNAERIKETFDESPYEMTSYSLHVVDGKKLNKLAENLTSSYIQTSEDYGFYFASENGASIEKIKLSEVEYTYEVTEKLNEMTDNGTGTMYVITPKGKTFKGIETKDIIEDITVSESGKYLYATIAKENDEETTEYELVRYNLDSSKLSKEETILENIASYYSISIHSDDMITARNEKDELIGYVKGKEVDISEDTAASAQYFDGYLYFLDNYEDEEGDLVRYAENGKKETLAEDVYSFVIYDANKIAYIKDYNDNKGYGDLYTCNKKGKETLIDSDVSRIFKYFDYE